MAFGADETMHAVGSNTISSGIPGGTIQTIGNWLSFPYNLPWNKQYTQLSGRGIAVRS